MEFKHSLHAPKNLLYYELSKNMYVYIGRRQKSINLLFPKACLSYLIATLLPSTTTGRRFSLSSSSCDGHSNRQESREELEEEAVEDEAKEDDKEEEVNCETVEPPCCSISVLVPSLTSSPRMSLMSASGPSFLSTSSTNSSE